MPHVARVRSAQLSSSASGSGLLQLVQSVVRQLLKAKEDSSGRQLNSIKITFRHLFGQFLGDFFAFKSYTEAHSIALEAVYAAILSLLGQFLGNF